MNEQQWQPISTVPKDGTWVLLYVPRTRPIPEDQVVFAVRWAEGWEVGRYVERWAVDGNEYLDINPPTHWMPCPVAPPVVHARRVVERRDPYTGRWVVDADTLHFREDLGDERLAKWIDLRVEFLASVSPGHVMTDRARWRIADYKEPQ